jgi:hypothetical protein
LIRVGGTTVAAVRCASVWVPPADLAPRCILALAMVPTRIMMIHAFHIASVFFLSR